LAADGLSPKISGAELLAAIMPATDFNSMATSLRYCRT
jgi:hypothetical protein